MAAIACGVALVLSACASSSSSGDGSASGSVAKSQVNLTALKAVVAAAEKAPTTIKSTAFGKFTPKPGGSIYLVSCDLTIVGCSRLEQGMKAATAAIGYKLQVCNTGSTETQMDGCFTNAVNAKPSAVIIDGNSAQAAGAGYAEVKKAGIPIVGAFTSNPSSVSDAEVADTTCSTEGKTLADAVIVGAKGKPNVLFFTETSQECDVQRSAAFKAEYQKECPGCAIKFIKFDYATMQQTLPAQVQAALTQNPSTNWVVGVFDQPASIAVTEVQQAGLASKVKVAGMDGVPANIQLIRKGQVQVYDLALCQQEDGWAAVDAAARLYSHVHVPFDINVSTYLVSPENVSSVPADNVWPGPANYPSQFTQLWKKS
ncbi:MAG TPA: substrate-binding domain-containing protein [Trebonia sp.]|jgi:ribose transport system substrate-binding protein|nr:substrate-binding domain-containing protein [Trebonia sp.]